MSESPIGRFDHVAIAVHTASRDAACRFMTDVLGARAGFARTQDDFAFQHFHLGDVKIEVLWPVAEQSFLTRFLEKHGEGLHHITVDVDDLEGTCARLAELDVRVVDKDTANPQWMTAFISPRSAFGVLYQLAQSDRLPKPRTGRGRERESAPGAKAPGTPAP